VSEVHELISMLEYGKRVGASVEAVRYAVKVGRINLTGERRGNAKLIDWTTEGSKWATNRLRDGKTCADNRRSKAGKSKERTERHKAKLIMDGKKAEHDWNKMEKHIGDSTLYDTGRMGIDPSTSRFDDIPDIDGIQAPEGSVAYYQAKKLAVDALRNLNKLKQETAQLISVPDAINLYCDVLRQLSDSVQTIPARLTNVIVANIKKSVQEWRTPPENLEGEVYRLLTVQCKEVLTEISEKVKKSATQTKDFIYENVTKR